jgi:CheY-like chemotaxis protein/anti-sigma regulatory factor (Ser/Thr protein kinase)
VDLAAVVVETATLLRRVLPEHIEVTVDGAYGPMGILADRGAVEQVLMNLATNARDAMPGGGRLVFRLRSAAGAHVLEVEDTGTGIPGEIRHRVFEPFFTTKDEGRGTGLGLAMVRSIVEHCQGTVAVESEPGRGTRFIIRCPMHEAPVARPPGAAGTARRGGSERILLVEDQPEIRRVAQRLLERAGYVVEISEDGETALTRLTDGGAPVQLVITDVVMPRLSGPELHEATRWMPRRPRFLFTSGYARQELPELAAGTAGFVQKPWTRDELLARVREILDRPMAELAA